MMTKIHDLMAEIRSIKKSISDGLAGIRAEVVEVKRMAQSVGSQASAARGDSGVTGTDGFIRKRRAV